MLYGRSPHCRTGSARRGIPPLFRPRRPVCGVTGGIGILVLLSETIPAANPIVAPEQRLVNESISSQRTFCECVIIGGAGLVILSRKYRVGGWREGGKWCIIAVENARCGHRGGAAAGLRPALRRPPQGRRRFRFACGEPEAAPPRKPAPCQNHRKGSILYETNSRTPGAAVGVLLF